MSRKPPTSTDQGQRGDREPRPVREEEGAGGGRARAQGQQREPVRVQHVAPHPGLGAPPAGRRPRRRLGRTAAMAQTVPIGPRSHVRLAEALRPTGRAATSGCRSIALARRPASLVGRRDDHTAQHLAGPHARGRRLAGFLDVDANAFGMTAPPELEESARETQEPGRDIGAYDDDVLVGIATAYSLELTVPGGTVPAAGVSWVGVLPTHRRRGVLRCADGLPARHESTNAGREPMAVLWASEPQIYGRFGYGLASPTTASMTVPRSATALSRDTPADPELRLRLVPAERLEDHRRGLCTRCGPAARACSARDDRWWPGRCVTSRALRDGGSALRCVVAEDDDGVRGLRPLSTKQNCDENSAAAGRRPRGRRCRPGRPRTAVPLPVRPGPDGQHCRVERPRRRPAAALAGEPRSGQAGADRTRSTCGWSTCPRHCGSRTYSSAVDVVLEVEDRRCPWNEGRWTWSRHTGQLRARHRPADLSMSVTDWTRPTWVARRSPTRHGRAGHRAPRRS